MSRTTRKRGHDEISKVVEETSSERPAKKTKTQKARAQELKERRQLHEQTVITATEENKRLGRKGQVRCAKQPHRRAPPEVPKTWPNLPGFMNISVCSGAAGIWNQLSPMKLGPITYEHGSERLVAKNLENLWQFSKVWEGEEGPDGLPTREWYERRRRGWADNKAHRHVKKGSSPNPNVPLYSWWKGEKLSYLEARKKIYCPEYARLVARTAAYKRLEELRDSGTNIQIIGYDGYDFTSEGKTLKECFEDTSRPFGHELVLVCMLRGEHPWED